MGLPIARDVLSTLREFRAAQEERVQKYNAFNEGFAAYLIHRQEGPYRELVAATTREFGAINERVRGAEARLRDDLARPDLATHLRAVQEAERSKLHFTLIQQVLREKEAERSLSWQRGSPAAGAHSVAGGAAAGAGAAEDGQGHAQQQAHRCSAAPEPTRQELSDALAEATQELQAAVVTINEALEEVRYAEEELLEDSEE